MPTIRKIPDSIESLTRNTDEYIAAVAELEATDSETFRLLQKWPMAADVGGNYAFNSILEDAVNPVIVANLVDETGGMLEGDAVIAAIGKLMIAEDRSHSIHCTLSEFVQLTTSIQWKLWAKLINNEDELKEKAALLGISIDKRKTLESNQQIASDAVRALF